MLAPAGSSRLSSVRPQMSFRRPKKSTLICMARVRRTGRSNGSLTDPLQSKTVSEHVTHIRVRYAETDQMGVVYHANYLIWMEVARTELCKRNGFRYRDMESGDGILLAVTEAHCRYLSAAR